jgi:hypothetical protein
MEFPQEYRYRGFEAEEELLGHKLDWENILQENKIPHEKHTRREWQQILEQVYPEDPLMPTKKWGKDLYNFVAEKLGIDVDDTESLKFYKTLGTDLDRMGIDCFFIFRNPITKKETTFTIDLTINPQKDEAKSNMVINTKEIPDHRKDPKGYIAVMEKFTEHIAKQLRGETEYRH